MKRQVRKHSWMNLWWCKGTKYVQLTWIVTGVYCAMAKLGTIHKHLLGGPDAKREALKICDPSKGALKKITTNFPVKIESTCFSMGLTHNFHGKKGGPAIFWGLKGAPKNFRDKFCIVFVNGPLRSKNIS